MKVISLQFVLQTALLSIVFAAAARAENTNTSAPSKRPPYSKQALQAKVEYCQTCHGPSGEGVRGASPVPRLAGQQTKYLENQLGNFILHRRQNIAMSNVVHEMSPALVTALAAYFNGLNPKPLGSAPRELVATGKKIFEEGVPEANVPPCASCHGPEAKGKGAIPRLAGQVHDYVFKKLTNWERERGQNPAIPDKSAAIMQPVAHGLTEAQIAAVAAYLDYLE
ncbi:MAG: c-type cytochrome [Rhodomicrobium sp.]